MFCFYIHAYRFFSQQFPGIQYPAIEQYAGIVSRRSINLQASKTMVIKHNKIICLDVKLKLLSTQFVLEKYKNKNATLILHWTKYITQSLIKRINLQNHFVLAKNFSLNSFGISERAN